MWLRSRRKWCIFYLASSLLTCIAVESLSFWFASIFWPTIPTKLAPNSTVILIVADPQLIGRRNEPKWIGWLSRWDADRYLRRGYSHAIASVQPDLDIYLGDLFDEGVHLDDSQFVEEKQRFHSIFSSRSVKNHIYLPGDNDIGGEMEPVYGQLVERFERLFQPTFTRHSKATALPFLTVYKTNPLRYGEIDGIYGGTDNVGKGNDDEQQLSIRLLLSHTPLLQMMSSSRVEQRLRAISIVLSGHDHTTGLYMQWRHSAAFRRTAFSSELGDTIRWTLSMDDPAALPLIEFKVPTCSYRMGVPAMGYGLLILTPFPGNGTALAQLSVLWLPSRYAQLLFYALLLVGLPLAWRLFGLVWRNCCLRSAMVTTTRRRRKVFGMGRKKRDEEEDDKRRTWGGSRNNAGGFYV